MKELLKSILASLPLKSRNKALSIYTNLIFKRTKKISENKEAERLANLFFEKKLEKIMQEKKIPSGSKIAQKMFN